MHVQYYICISNEKYKYSTNIGNNNYKIMQLRKRINVNFKLQQFKGYTFKE